MATELFWNSSSRVRNGLQKERFRARFQHSLRSCVERGFTVEESFGMIWVETWEDFSLTEEEQSDLYDELIRWAKSSLLTERPQLSALIHQSYSPSRAAV